MSKDKIGAQGAAKRFLELRERRLKAKLAQIGFKLERNDGVQGALSRPVLYTIVGPTQKSFVRFMDGTSLPSESFDEWTELDLSEAEEMADEIAAEEELMGATS